MICLNPLVVWLLHRGTFVFHVFINDLRVYACITFISRRREMLLVLEGSLHHIQYTDAVDRILRGSRLSCVLKNLQEFFT